MDSQDLRNNVFEQNLRALRSHGAPTLAVALSAATPDTHVVIERAKNGEPVPVHRRANRDWWLYSRYSPSSEMERLTEALMPSQSITVVGFATGRHVQSLLAGSFPMNVTMIPEPVPELRLLFEHFDFRGILSDPRVCIVDYPSVESSGKNGQSYSELASSAADSLSNNFVPLFTHGLVTSIPSGVRALYPGIAEAAARAVQLAAERIADDMTSYRRFGLLWMRNILLNLPTALTNRTLPAFPPRITVTAAGPELESWIKAEKRKQRLQHAAVLSTDTAAPALRAHGLRPFAIVSIDPSPYSYHHLLCGADGETWILDIAANPLLWRNAEDPVPVYSKHPLLQLLLQQLTAEDSARLLRFAAKDVSQAAVQIASRCGGAEIILAGADFSYPYCKTYARGSYIPTLFESSSDRYTPTETKHIAFALRSPRAYRNHLSKAVHTPGLDNAHRSMQLLRKNMRTQTTLRFFSKAETPESNGKNDMKPDRETRRYEQGQTYSPAFIRKRLTELRSEFEFIPSPERTDMSAADYYRYMSARQRSLITALIPAALAIPGARWNEQLSRATTRFLALLSDIYDV